jgi:hypothetical protein
MTPLEQLRLWARQASIWQRVTASSGAVALVGLLSWTLFPAGTPAGDPLAASSIAGSQQESATATTSPTDTAPVAGGPTESTSGPATGPASSTGPATGPAGPAGSANAGKAGCASPPGTDQGVSATEIQVAFILVDLSGAMVNSFTGTPPVEDQRANIEALLAGMNAEGGVACRKLVGRYYEGNPIDPTSLQRVCLKIAQDRPFYVIDNGAYFLFPQLTAGCTDKQLPIFTPGLLPQGTQRAKYPYLFGGGLMEVVHRNMVLALGHRGWFGAGNGFQKLGLLYRSCNATLPGALAGWVAQAGVPSDKVVKHDVGCPPATAPPSELQQAVLDFKTAGVTHLVMVEDEIDFANFTSLAEKQAFRPKYAVPATMIGQTYATSHADYANIADTIVIAQTRHGEERTPGMTPTAATQRCDNWLKAKGRAPTWTTPVGIAGNDCFALAMFKASAEHAPAIARNALAAGLQATGTLDLNYPGGPSDFRVPYTTYAGQNWRVVRFFPSCNCMRVVEPNFQPSFR